MLEVLCRSLLHCELTIPFVTVAIYALFTCNELFLNNAV